jgi:hypothetical protein
VWLQDRFEADLPAIDPTRVMHTHDWVSRFNNIPHRCAVMSIVSRGTHGSFPGTSVAQYADDMIA